MASDGLAPSAFDPSLNYSTDKIVLFWQPPSYFLRWSPSSFSWTMADHRAVELIMSSSDPSTHKLIGRIVHNFDSAVWDREKHIAVLSGTYAKFKQDPVMKHHLLSTGNKISADASPLDAVWDIGLRADDPRGLTIHANGEGKIAR